jgi:hypothetical protein
VGARIEAVADLTRGGSRGEQTARKRSDYYEREEAQPALEQDPTCLVAEGEPRS